jgi:LacI family transcriptional regulator
MGKMANRVSLQDVAAAAGVHVSTVSLALRQDPRLPETTRARIQEVAQRLGYRTNPLVSAWLRQVRQPEIAQAGVGLAILAGTNADEPTAREPYYQVLLEGARAEAQALGYHVSETRFGADDEDLLLRTLSKLRYRGVRGVLVFDPAECLTQAVARDLEKGFAVVVLLRAASSERFHRVGTDVAHNITLALTQLRDLGRRRIAFHVHPSQVSRLRRDALASFLWHQQQWPASERLPLPDRIVEHSPELFLDYIRRVRPDALLSVNFSLHGILEDAGHRMPGDLFYAHIGTDARTWLSGVLNRGFEVGRDAVFQLAGLVSGNRLGVPDVPLNTLVPGVWADGTGTPPALAPREAESPAQRRSRPGAVNAKPPRTRPPPGPGSPRR